MCVFWYVCVDLISVYSTYPPTILSNQCLYSSAKEFSRDVKKEVSAVSSKPPNVLIYSGSSDTDDRTFQSVKQALLQVLNVHSYAIYRLHEQHVSTHPWMDNTALLVLGNSDSIPASVQKDFVKFLRNGGSILGLCSRFTCQTIKHPWDDRYQPFVASIEVNHQQLFQGEPQNFSALCDPFYFEGECY